MIRDTSFRDLGKEGQIVDGVDSDREVNEVRVG